MNYEEVSELEELVDLSFRESKNWIHNPKISIVKPNTVGVLFKRRYNKAKFKRIRKSLMEHEGVYNSTTPHTPTNYIVFVTPDIIILL